MKIFEKAFIPTFMLVALVSGLILGSVIPVLLVLVPMVAIPLMMYGFMYVEKIRTNSNEDEVTHVQTQSLAYTQAVGADNVIELSARRPLLHAFASAQDQIEEIQRRDLPNLVETMPSDGSVVQHFTLTDKGQWVYRFHLRSTRAEFNAVGVGTQPKEAFSIAEQVLHKQIREWHAVRNIESSFYMGQENHGLLDSLSATTDRVSPTVLIVEDDVDLAMATQSIFKQLGCKTILSDGKDGASHKMSFKEVDFIVLDWMLGNNVSGDDLVKKSSRIIRAFEDLHSKFQKHHAKVITYSVLDRSKVGLPQSEYFEHVDHWQKPVKYSELATRASELLVANGY